MVNRIFLLVLSFIVSFSVQSQIIKESDSLIKDKESLSVLQIVDSLFIDHNIKNYSLRLFTNYKVKKFNIRNDNSKLQYVPNNKYGVGFGFASSKVLIDIAFNLKTNKEEITNRFDAQGTLIVGKHHYVNGFLQLYKGFNVKNDFNEPSVFRSDIKSVTVGFNYLFTLSEIEFSYSLLKAGLAKRNKNVYITGGLGFFGVYDSFSADSDIMPENGELYFNEQAHIKRYNSAAVGVLGGFLSVFMLPKNFIASCNIMPGIALMNKKVDLEDDNYRPSNPMLYKLDYTLALGYNAKRYYITLIYADGLYSTSLDYGNKYVFSLTKAKLAFGYKLGVNKLKKRDKH
ncbi:DUF4421 family protein [Xanthomarina spongicola]|uniref:Uncharacterized protein DUF4421 n=1 Tax=Xanthomarina spongicola TaxID=570520 RepID=A0A316DIH0_9FLAO|nr:DUF4421 family protein [Xanthomarina spongicola]PWK17964.1 uncharacterized protein DUF4421 [Xanthomarina spongicola]